MSNIFKNKAGRLEDVWISNGQTPLVFSALLLAGSEIAKTLWEKECVVWWAEHDSSLMGSTCGFDVDELAWSPEEFDRQKEFVIRTIELALTQYRWGDADLPQGKFAESILNPLQELRQLFEGYTHSDVTLTTSWRWRMDRQRFDFCALHRVYQHQHGCLICNDLKLRS